MTETGVTTITELRPGLELGPGDWIEVGQAEIDAFAAATGDHQWIHTDPRRAATGPFGTTIAHGWFSLSLLAPLSADLLPLDGAMTVNYGADRVRFPAALPSGSRVRARLKVESAERFEGGVRLEVGAAVEAEGVEKPVCVATLIYLVYD